MSEIDDAIKRIEWDIDSCKKGNCPHFLKIYKAALAALRLVKWIENEDCPVVATLFKEITLAKFQQFKHEDTDEKE